MVRRPSPIRSSTRSGPDGQNRHGDHRRSGSQTTVFDQLIKQAGGIDRNVEELPAAQKNRFYRLAGFSSGPAPSGSTKPPAPEVPPDTAGNFPAGHRLQSLPKGGEEV